MSHTEEYELIAHSHLADCSMFLVELYYRPLHLHKELELILVLQGQGDVYSEQTSFSVHEGDILLFGSGEAHELSGGEEGLLLLTIQISRGFCVRYCPQLRNTRFGVNRISPDDDPAQTAAIRAAMLDAFSTYLDRSIPGTFFCMGHVNRLFALLFSSVPYQLLSPSELQSRTKSQNRIRRILAYLEEHFREPVRLRDLAELEHITTAHLSHIFREKLNITLQDYLMRLRVEAAMSMLKNTSLTPTAIAYECGFSDPRYLNQSFARILGMTPSQWRAGSGGGTLQRTRDDREYTMQRILTDEEAHMRMQRAGILKTKTE